MCSISGLASEYIAAQWSMPVLPLEFQILDMAADSFMLKAG